MPNLYQLENPINKYATQVFSADEKQIGTWSYSKANRIFVDYEDFQIALPVYGKLTEVLTSNDKKYGGNGKGNLEPVLTDCEPFLDMNYSARIKLPGLSCIYFHFIP